jgi:hypothetical protein
MPLEFTRVSPKNPCPICQKPDFCELGDRAVLCQRVESDHPNKNPAGGWFHHFGTKNAPDKLLAAKKPRFVPQLKEPEHLLQSWRGAFNQFTVNTLADKLGVSVGSLHELECTFVSSYFGFPMRDDTGKVIGIRTRDWNGNKKAITGSRAGLFYSQSPEALELLERFNVAFLAEGPTDTSALLTLGFYAVGRPNCMSGNDYVIKLLKRFKISRAVIVSDNDEIKTGGKRPGLVGANQLKKQLGIPSVLWMPPSPIKDVREFVSEGGTRELIEDDLRNSIWTK